MLFYVVIDCLATMTQGGAVSFFLSLGFTMHLYNVGPRSNIKTCLDESSHRWRKLYKLMEKGYEISKPSRAESHA